MPPNLRLRQLQLLHRHGDRTPLHNVFRGSSVAADELDERKHWESQLPPTDELVALRDKFAVLDETVRLPGSAPFQQRPFGYLTSRGIQQMTRRGQRVRDFCGAADFDVEAVRAEDVQIFSNAYTRTQLSVQALLGGMLGPEPHVLPPVRVLPPETDIINAYAAFPEIMQLKAELEMDDAAFAAREHDMSRTKQELMLALPMFASGAVPFQWMYAADYFMCRRAHDIAMLLGSETHANATVQHLGYRFRQFYSHRRILHLVAGRLMHNVLREMKLATADHPDKKRIVVYSGHDVSILSVLHAINASLTDDSTFWPDYSSALALELLEDDRGQWFVRARLDGEILSLKQAASPVLQLGEFTDLVADRIGHAPP